VKNQKFYPCPRKCVFLYEGKQNQQVEAKKMMSLSCTQEIHFLDYHEDKI
jgi:hypothetical protein